MKDSEILRWEPPEGYKPSRPVPGGLAGDNATHKRRSRPPRGKRSKERTIPGTRLSGKDSKVYGERGRILRGMGFDSYEHYLASGLWKRLRRKALKRCKWKCCSCGCRAVQVHHRNYSKRTLTKGGARGLVAICVECHQAAEFRGGLKVGLAEANRRLRRLIKANAKRRRIVNSL